MFFLILKTKRIILTIGGKMLIELEGHLERITYTDEKTGFTIAKVIVPGRRDPVTVVANLMAPSPGEFLKMKGAWVRHPKYGRQFKVVHYETAVPATIEGIRRYLGSGLIKGIGPKMADLIVKEFGENTLDIIENDLQRLAQIKGIGEKTIQKIKKDWNEKEQTRDLMLFLHSYGVGSTFAVKIFDTYKQRSIALIKANPYRLATDISGIGFITADRIAEKLGFPKDSPVRASAGVLYVLDRFAEEGHVFYPYEALLSACTETLQIDRDTIAQAVGDLAIDKRIVIEDLNESVEAFRENHKAVYPAKFYTCETGIAAKLKLLANELKSIRKIDTDRAVAWVQKHLDIRLAENQVEAVRCAIENKIMVITGGPGTGKTTIINAVIKIFSSKTEKIMLASPTGRAAKRLSESTGHPAKTIHRLLEYSFQKGGFQKNDGHPLDCDLLIIDETSMVDTVLMHHLLKAVPSCATLILVGDVNQLPSVGPGNILGDIIASKVAPVVTLNEIFRQAKESRIIVNAHHINNGIVPSFSAKGEKSDCFFIEQEDPDKVLQLILELVKERIPKRFGLDPVHDIQVLAPMHKGVVGTSNLNVELQNALNPGTSLVTRAGLSFRIHDKVMQTRNNYDKDVFNGDIGRIVRIEQEDQEAVVKFEDRLIAYAFSELDEIMPAYAVSVHKSQGSEYPAVVIPVLTQHYTLLQRNLIYTAVTRGRRLVVLVGTRRALAIAVKNDTPHRRFTYLNVRLSA
jgi:exodeoxyribonuclease V alpha subunit